MTEQRNLELGEPVGMTDCERRNLEKPDAGSAGSRGPALCGVETAMQKWRISSHFGGASFGGAGPDLHCHQAEAGEALPPKRGGLFEFGKERLRS